MINLLKAGRGIVNSAPMRSLGPLRSEIKKMLQWGASKVSNGTLVKVGKGREMLVPWDFVGASNWYDYEPKSTEFFAGLIDKEPESIVADIGCSIGIYSLLALSVSRKTEVYSMDADLMSLAIAKHMCRATAGGRHRLLWGLCGDGRMSESNPMRNDISVAVTQSSRKLAASALRPSLGKNTYTCIGTERSEGIPFWDVDSLFLPLAKTGRPIILKVDIEGAEIAMVRGAAELANHPNVQILLSVHPHVLHKWNTTDKELRDILVERGYEITLLEVSTEQHWWVSKA